MGRQLVDHALTGRDLTWPEDRVAAARIAAGILAKAPLDTWQRELTAVTARTGLSADLLHTVLAERIGVTDTDADALGRLTGRDRREDLDRGQHVPATPGQLAAMSAPRGGVLRAAASHPADTPNRTRGLNAIHSRTQH